MGDRQDKLKEFLEIMKTRVEFPLGEYTSDKGPLLIKASPFIKPSLNKPRIGVRGSFGNKRKLEQSRKSYNKRND